MTPVHLPAMKLLVRARRVELRFIGNRPIFFPLEEARMEPVLRIGLRYQLYQSCALPLSETGVEPKSGYDPPSERYECSILPIELLRHGARRVT